MKIFNKSLQFMNRQIVRLNWGYAKFYVFLFFINAVSNLITALSITQTFSITLIDIICLYFGTIILSIIVIYIFSKMNILQDETKQIFDERTNVLYFKQVNYQSLLIALDMRKSKEELIKEKKELEKKLFGKDKNEK